MQKKLLGILLVLCMLLAALPFALSASAADVEEIATADELKALMDSTDATVLGKDYKLTANIDMTDVEGQSPIGDRTTPFTGTFDGANFAITNLDLDSASAGTGLFGALGNTKEDPAIVKDLTLTGSISSSAANNGAVAGLVNASATIQNVTSRVSISANAVIGGMVGLVDLTGAAAAEINIEGCINLGTLAPGSTENSQTGGIVGLISVKGTGDPDQDVTVSNCLNTVDITTGYRRVGGIVGEILLYGDTDNTAILVEECVNTGDIISQYTATSGAFVAGIVGRASMEDNATTSGTMKIVRCKNEGRVTAPSHFGGIVGYMYTKNFSNPTMPEAWECWNAGTITGTAKFFGGIAGLQNRGNVYDCLNTGEIVATGATGAVGGITGHCALSETKYCYNAGKVTGGTVSGALVGVNDRATCADNYYDATASGVGAGTSAVGTAYDGSDAAFALLNANSAWTNTSGIALASAHVHSGFTAAVNANGSISYTCAGCSTVVYTAARTDSTDVYVNAAATGLADLSFADLLTYAYGSETTPVATFAEAITYAAALASDAETSVTVHLVGEVNAPADYAFPTYAGAITITGDGTGILGTSAGNMCANGTLTFEKLTFKNNGGRLFFLAQNQKVTFGAGLTNTGSGNMCIYGGFQGGNGQVIASDLTVRSGTYVVVAAWNNGVSTNSGEGKLTVGASGSDSLKITALVAYTHGGSNSQALTANSKSTIIIDGNLDALGDTQCIRVTTMNGTTAATNDAGYTFTTDLVVKAALPALYLDDSDGTAPQYYLNIYVDQRDEAIVTAMDTVLAHQNSVANLATCSEVIESTYVAYCAANNLGEVHEADADLGSTNNCSECGAMLRELTAADIFALEDFGFYGESFNLGWKYTDSLDTDTVTALEAGMKDADGNLIVKYTASGNQLAFQKENNLLVKGGSAGITFSSDVSDSTDSAWTITCGSAFESWQVATGYVTVTVGENSYTLTENSEHEHNYVGTACACGVTLAVTDIFMLEDFGWADAFNLDWKYGEDFDTDFITAIEVGMKNAEGELIVKYTASGDQLVYQKDNGYITAAKQSRALFSKTVSEGAALDWTVTFGDAYDAWNVATGYVTVTVGEDSYTQEKASSHEHNFVSNTCAACGASDKSTNIAGIAGAIIVGQQNSNPKVYSVLTGNIVNGTVTASQDKSASGKTITLTVQANAGYVLDTLTVKSANGRTLTLTDKGNGTYTFTMPASVANVSATFKSTGAFGDVTADDYYNDAVAWAVEVGITNGTGDGAFSPNMICDRAQMVTFLWRAAGSPEPATQNNPFTDVAADAYYAKAVLWAVENKLVYGTTETTFSPTEKCTRAHMATIMYRFASGKAQGTAALFTDVAANAYYAEAVAWAAEQGLIYGTTETTFSPNDNCLRGQIVTILYRYFVK